MRRDLGPLRRLTSLPPTPTLPSASALSLPHPALTSAGHHVHALLVLADGPRLAGCPGDEVYNGTICPSAMAPSRDGSSTGHRAPLYAAMRGQGPGPNTRGSVAVG